MRRDAPDGGFTLIEMIVALALVSMVGSVLAYTLRPKSMATNPREITRLIAGQARAASLKAVSTGRTSVLRLNLDRREVSVDGTGAAVTIPPGQGITMKSAEQLVTAGRTGSIEFFADGSSSGGEIIVGTNPANQFAVRVFWLTGEITTRPVR